MPTPKKVRLADSFRRSHEKSPSMQRPALSFATVQWPLDDTDLPPLKRHHFQKENLVVSQPKDRIQCHAERKNWLRRSLRSSDSFGFRPTPVPALLVTGTKLDHRD